MHISHTLHLLGAVHEQIDGGPLIVAGRGFTCLVFLRRDGRGGAQWGSRNLCTICGMILTSSYEKPRGPFFIGSKHCEERREGGMTSGKATSRSALLVPLSFGPLLDYSCARAGGTQGSPSITSFHHSRAKQESFLVRTRQFT